MSKSNMMSPTLEKYTLKIFNIINQISELEKAIEHRKGMKTYSNKESDKIIIDSILKLQNAKIELQKAINCLLCRVKKD